MENMKFCEKIFYHIYALGLGGCQRYNDFSCGPGDFFEKLESYLDRIKGLGCNALLIGPIFESCAHGYDTLDYFHVDRRLGNNEKFARFAKICHEKGFSLCLDAVFNHTGREFFAFKDLIQKGRESQFCGWYKNLNFDGRSCYGDPFDYEGWAGCKDLVKLNLRNQDVQNHIFSAVEFWINEFGIDGLRLDASDVIDKDFLSSLAGFCKSKKNGFWLMGEVVHGDYTQWACKDRIDSVTNYQIYKALWSSVNDNNFFELSYNLEREFDCHRGLYNYSALYNFADNHDVNRLGSVLKEPEKKINLVYSLEWTIPGIPSVYYGSEYGIRGERKNGTDFELRPCLPPFGPMPEFAWPNFEGQKVYNHISRLSWIRNSSEALQKGTFRLATVSNKQIGFWREYGAQRILVLANISDNVEMKGDWIEEGEYEDLFDGTKYYVHCRKSFFINRNAVMILKKLS